jgi:hypothetical protein
MTAPEKIAPVQGYNLGIPWALHLEAYAAYCKRYGPQQALIEGGCRGGFGTEELDQFIPGWRDKVSEIGRLKARIAELESASSKPNRADLYFAAIDCEHSISEDRIILRRNPALPGNALSQLADRLIAAALGAQS